MASHSTSTERGAPGSPESSEALDKRLAVVIPAYNEAERIAEEIREVHATLAETEWEYEVIVVDDGSTDTTAAKAIEHPARLIRHEANRGYGAAIMSGVGATEAPYVLITDADGTYPAEAIPRLLARLPGADMVVGARIGTNVSIPLLRRPAKKFLGWLASYLAERRIPDLNSGLRVVRRDQLRRYRHLLPTGFSFTSTITLALICNGQEVRYEPIDYRERVGDSKIRATDTYRFVIHVIRTILYFNPLRVFLPLGLIPFVGGTAKLIYDLTLSDISESAVMGILSGFLLWAVGMLADLVVRLHRANDPE